MVYTKFQKGLQKILREQKTISLNKMVVTKEHILISGFVSQPTLDKILAFCNLENAFYYLDEHGLTIFFV